MKVISHMMEKVKIARIIPCRNCRAGAVVKIRVASLSVIASQKPDFLLWQIILFLIPSEQLPQIHSEKTIRFRKRQTSSKYRSEPRLFRH